MNKTIGIFILCLWALGSQGTPLGDALVEEARKGPHCQPDRIDHLIRAGARVPVADWMVWYPEIIGCGDLAQKAYLSTVADKREALAMLGMSGVLEQFQKLRSTLRDELSSKKTKSAKGSREAKRIALDFHFLKREMVRRCGRGSRVACDIHLRARAFQSSLRDHLKSAQSRQEVRSLPRQNRKRWQQILKNTAQPFL